MERDRWRNESNNFGENLLGTAQRERVGSRDPKRTQSIGLLSVQIICKGISGQGFPLPILMAVITLRIYSSVDKLCSSSRESIHIFVAKF